MNVLTDNQNNLYTWGVNGLGAFMNPNLLQTPGVADAWMKRGLLKQISPAPAAQTAQSTSAGGGDVFANAMSGGAKGTLQPWVNRMTQNASDALYGGLLNYSPKPMIAGNAGGTPQNSSAPQGFNLPPGLLNAVMGQRHWMK